MNDEADPQANTTAKKKTGPFGLSKRTHAIIFVVSVIIEITLIAIFGVSIWQGAKWAWAWLTGG